MISIKEADKWLEAVSQYYSLSKSEILKVTKHNLYCRTAKNMFYWLCFKEGIDLYRLSESLGKHRTTVISSIKKGDKPNREILNKIWYNVKLRESTERMEPSD